MRLELTSVFIEHLVADVGSGFNSSNGWLENLFSFGGRKHG